MNYYNEFDPAAAEWLKNLITAGLIPAGDVDSRSITEVQPDELRRYTQCHFFAGIGGWSYALQLAGWPADRPVWTGSCPCQPFSSAGRQKGTADERHLWPVWFDLIRSVRPPVVMGEQVAAAIGHGWIDGVFDDLEAEGYTCWSAIVPACAVNAPHRRDRLWFVADAAKQGFQDGGRSSLVQSGEVEKLERLCCGGSCCAKPNICDGNNCALANASSGRCCEQREGQIQQPGRAETIGSGGGNVAHPSSPQREPGSEVGGILSPLCGHGAVCDHADGSGAACDVAHAERERLPRQGQMGEPGNPAQGGDGQANQSVNDSAGYWDNAEWITGADGKARRVELSIRLLADGVPARVVKLRAFGNAIVPEVAAEIIGAYMNINKLFDVS